MSINAVAPLAGAWIEIVYTYATNHPINTSLPSRERGLKLAGSHGSGCVDYVAPLAGAWIEIGRAESGNISKPVAPLAGAWIEIGTIATKAITQSRRSPRGSVD